jgi:addiction module RelB/DinJ family antitoxin
MNSTINIRIDKELKEDVKKMLKKAGLDISSVVKLFLQEVVRTGSLPFEFTEDFKTKLQHIKKVKGSL